MSWSDKMSTISVAADHCNWMCAASTARTVVTSKGCYLQRDVHTAQKVVLAAGPSALGNLLEEASQALNTSHLIQLADGVKHGGFVVVVPASEQPPLCIQHCLTWKYKLYIYQTVQAYTEDSVC